MRYLRIEFLLAAILAWPALSGAAGEGGLEPALAGFGLSWEDAGTCSLYKIYTRGDCSSAKGCFSTVTGACGELRLRFEIAAGITEKEARKYMTARFTRIRMLYGGHAEYPGVVTARVEVPPELIARLVEKGPLGYEALYMPATESMVYGAGANDLIKYSAATSYIYCAGKRTLGQVEIFAPKDTGAEALNAALRNFFCAKKSAAGDKK